jgi:hypothetical protein
VFYGNEVKKKKKITVTSSTPERSNRVTEDSKFGEVKEQDILYTTLRAASDPILVALRKAGVFTLGAGETFEATIDDIGDTFVTAGEGDSEITLTEIDSGGLICGEEVLR